MGLFDFPSRKFSTSKKSISVSATVSDDHFSSSLASDHIKHFSLSLEEITTTTAPLCIKLMPSKVRFSANYVVE